MDVSFTAFPTLTWRMLTTKANAFHSHLTCHSCLPGVPLSWFSSFLAAASSSPSVSWLPPAAAVPRVVFSPLMLQARPVAVPPVPCYVDCRSASTRMALPKLQPHIFGYLLPVSTYLPPKHLRLNIFKLIVFPLNSGSLFFFLILFFFIQQVLISYLFYTY